VITTNFDRVLERAFEANGAPFESVISGPRPDLIVDGLHGNRHVLIKLHGDWQDRVGRTFARSDYDANYGKAQPENKRALLEAAESLLFSSRSLLFVGASLGPDRTVDVLQEVHKRYAGIRHFAIMSVPTKPGRDGKSDWDIRAFQKKERQLGECGVLPLWYRAENRDDHAREVCRLVESIVERVSVRPISAAIRPQRRPKPKAAPPPRRPGLAEFSQPPLPHFQRMLRFIEAGRLTFFLGSAIHAPTPVMAEKFYEELARVFECEALGVRRSAVAQYIADRHGRENLNSEIRKLLTDTPFEPRETHEFFADWKQLRGASGQPLPWPMVLTTNYDNVLERRLDAADVPYHLLSYQSVGPEHGRFYHRLPDGPLRVIDRPESIRTLTGGIVLVKLNGGVDAQNGIPECYSTTRLDYWDLASRIPGVLPAAVRDRLQETPLLFLGHGLKEADVESLIRFAHRNHPGPRSWAVVLKQLNEYQYWRQCGVELLDSPISLFVRELHARLSPRARVGE
jgi:hypothetical protein